MDFLAISTCIFNMHLKSQMSYRELLVFLSCLPLTCSSLGVLHQNKQQQYSPHCSNQRPQSHPSRAPHPIHYQVLICLLSKCGLTFCMSFMSTPLSFFFLDTALTLPWPPFLHRCPHTIYFPLRNQDVVV